MIASSLKPRDHVLIDGVDVVLDSVNPCGRGMRGIVLTGLTADGAGWEAEVSASKPVELIDSDKRRSAPQPGSVQLNGKSYPSVRAAAKAKRVTMGRVKKRLAVETGKGETGG